MTYLTTTTPSRLRARYGKRRPAMSGIFDILLGPLQNQAGDEVDCLNQANKTQVIADLDAKVADLAKNWNPTGYYTATDIQTVYNEMTTAISGARAALLVAMMSTSDAEQQVKQAQAYLNRSAERGALYPTAIASARSGGVTAINAPGLKQWVLETLVNVGQAYTTVAVLSCRATWLDDVVQVFAKAWSVVKRIVGIAIKAGDTVLTLADDVLNLYTVIKWGALGIGALFVYWKIKDMRKGT